MWFPSPQQFQLSIAKEEDDGGGENPPVPHPVEKIGID